MSQSKSDRIVPQNFPEWLIWICMISTYVWFFTGLTYVVGSVLGWILTFYLLIKLYLQDGDTPPEEKITIPMIIWIWLIGMGVMEVALIIGHLDFDLPTSKIIIIDRMGERLGITGLISFNWLFTDSSPNHLSSGLYHWLANCFVVTIICPCPDFKTTRSVVYRHSC